jgi:gamma-glutamylaminecyclotransferase
MHEKKTPMPRPLHRIFVYGSLRRGLHNHRLLSGAHFDGEAFTSRGFRLYDLGSFPGMVAEGTDRVHGEVFLVDMATLEALDRLESHPRFYRRTVIQLDDDVEAESYLLTPQQVEGCSLVRDGDWRCHYQERTQR